MTATNHNVAVARVQPDKLTAAVSTAAVRIMAKYLEHRPD